MKDPLVSGMVLIVLDIALWRLALPRNATLRLLARLVIFGLFTALLFSSGLNPFATAPWPESPMRHLAAQVLAIAWWLTGARLLTLTLDAFFVRRDWHRERLFQDVLGAIVFLAAVVASLAFVLGLPITGLVATSGALAIVLGLAIQSTLSDVFAGIVLNTTEPYHIGNWVSVDGVEGKVMEMNWRATHLLTSQGNIVIVPNSVAAKAKITNSSRPSSLHGVTITLEISPEERPATVLAALERAIAGVSNVMKDPPPFALVKRALTNSIEYQVTAYVDDMSRKTSVNNALYDLCHRHLAAAGIDLHSLGVPLQPQREVVSRRQRLLANVELFHALHGDEIEALSKRLSRHEYESDQIVVASDDVTDYLMIVESGVLSVEVDGPAGRVETTRLGPGDSIGEAGVLAGLPVQAQIKALTRTVLYRLDKEDLTPFLKSRPEIGQRMCRLLSERQDSLRRISVVPDTEEDTEWGVFEWLREGMRKLHELTT
ncbi:MAG TPA: mechanosensitive ion channel family protein [Paraburkholderia sp.]|nr:mechanosensitive ion channel family protein [Paraburkholderia sp.]